MDFLTVIIVLALLATVGAMYLGLTALGHGGALDKDYGTRIMWFRVGLQAVTILLLLGAILLRS